MSTLPRFRSGPWPTAEQQLLLAAALVPGARGAEAYACWRARIDPDGHFDPEVFRLLPLVYHQLEARGVRDALTGRLKGVYRRAWCETHRLFHATAPVIERLVSSGCEVLLLKGAAMVMAYYRNHALRPMADLDVVVRAAQLPRAVSILASAGYTSPSPLTADLVRFHHAASFHHPAGGHIDLHWHVLFEAPSRAADEAFWIGSEPGEFLGTPVRYPDPTTILLQTIVHGLRSNPEPPVRWIPDALTVLQTRAEAIAWPRLEGIADQHRLSYRLGLGLLYLASAFDAKIPAASLRHLIREPSLIERVENTVMLADPDRWTRSAIGTHWALFTEFCRFAPRGPLAFLTAYSEFLRYRYDLGSRRNLLPFLVRGVGRRVFQDEARIGP